MLTGTLFALAAGLMWGLVFVVPLLLPEYPPALLSVSRYLAFGLIALPLAWLDRAGLRELSRADWTEAAKLALVGNLLYYLFLAAAIQRAGGPLPTVIIGTLPVVIAISANLRDAGRDGHLPWRQLAPSPGSRPQELQVRSIRAQGRGATRSGTSISASVRPPWCPMSRVSFPGYR